MLFLKNILLVVLLVIASAGGYFFALKSEESGIAEFCAGAGGEMVRIDKSVCVISQASAPLTLGPVVINADDLLHFEKYDKDGAYGVLLQLKPDVRKALAVYTGQAIGTSLDIRVEDELINSVNIVEPISTKDFLLVMPVSQVNRLESIFNQAE